MTTRADLSSMERRRRLADAEPGFAGPGHCAVEVFGSTTLAVTDPFVLLMDDRIDFQAGAKIGGAHPHAGLETVTFMLEGSLDDRDEGPMRAGDAVWMTAGRGIIHNANVYAGERSRLLQLWVTLPEVHRAAPPASSTNRHEDRVAPHRNQENLNETDLHTRRVLDRTAHRALRTRPPAQSPTCRFHAR